MRDLNPREMLALAWTLAAGARFLRRAPHWSRDEMQAWQFARIQQLVRHAWANVPFYRQLYASVSFQPDDLRSWDDFRRLPLVIKDDVIANYPARMLAAGLKPEQLIVSRSSGSSGKVLDIAYDSRALVTYMLAGLRLYQMGFHYRPWHWQLYIYTSPYPFRSVFGLYPLHFISTLSPMEEIVAAIKRVNPDLLVCYPSHLQQIVQAMTDADIVALLLQSISINSEMSTQGERDALAERLRCPVLDEYSSEELTRIAAQCRHKTYHVFEDINYIETLSDGVIAGTNLHNYAMPMIRYIQNDLGALNDQPCACGWRFRRLVNLQGRKNDSFVLPSGKVLSSGFLLDATYEFLLAYQLVVRDFCLIQQTESSVVLQIVAGTSWNDDIEKKISQRFHEFLGRGVSFRVAVVDVCEKTKTGKRNPIISYIGRALPAENGI
jgi:phenylacetate-CoA ligase